MGVYVKDMVMPDNCYECPCLREDDLDGVKALQCNVTFRTDVGGGRRPAECPLVEVGTPHGRLSSRQNHERTATGSGIAL